MWCGQAAGPAGPRRPAGLGLCVEAPCEQEAGAVSRACLLVVPLFPSGRQELFPHVLLKRPALLELSLLATWSGFCADGVSPSCALLLVLCLALCFLLLFVFLGLFCLAAPGLSCGVQDL